MGISSSSDDAQDASEEPGRTIAKAYAELGRSLVRAGDELKDAEKTAEAESRYEEAAQAFLRAIREGGRSRSVGMQLGRTRAKQGRLEDAIREYLHVVRADPASAMESLREVHRVLTPALARALGSWIDSEWTQRILRSVTDPRRRAAVHDFLGRVSLYRANYAAAVEYYRAALAATPTPDDLYVLEGLGESLWRAGQPADAIPFLEQAVRRADSARVSVRPLASRHKLGLTYIALGRYQDAIRVLRQVLALARGAHADSWTALARARLALGRFDGAARAAERAVELDNSAAAPHAVLAAARLEQRKYSEAVAAAEAALSRDPHELVAIRVKGRALLDGKTDVDQGIRLIRRYLEESSRDDEHRLLLAQALRSAGHSPSEIIDVLRPGVALKTGDKPARLYLELADAYRLAGDTASALRMLDDPAAQQTGEDSGRSWQIRGDVLSASGETAGALEAYERAADASPDDGGLLLNLALAARTAGNKERAWSAISSAIKAGLSGDDRLNAFALKAELGDALYSRTSEPSYVVEGRTQERRERVPPSEFVEAWFEAGRQFYWKGDSDQALRWLGRVTDLYREFGLHPEARWYRVDALPMRAAEPKYPYWNANRLADARRAWQEALSAGRPDRTDAWAYTSVAMIADAQTQISPPAQRAALVWEALAYLERALVLDVSSGFAWMQLSRLQRATDNYANSLLASERALQIDPDDLDAIDARAAAFANVGNAEGAREAIDKRLQRERTPLAEGLHAFVLYLQNDLEAAVEQIGRVIESDPIWNLSFRGDCSRLLALKAKAPDVHRERARADYLKILERKRDDAYRASQATFGWAAYGSGDVPSAIEMLKPLLNDAVDPSCDTDRNMGCCYLRLGELKRAEEHLNRGIDFSNTANQLYTLESLLLAEIEQDAVEWSNHAPVLAVVHRARERIKKVRERKDWPPSPQAELRRFVDWPEARAQTEDWCVIAANAGLARIALHEGEMEEAVAIYRTLLKDPRFPEAAEGLGNVAARYRASGDDAIRKGWDQPDARQEAVSLFERALLLKDAVSPYDYAELLARLALARFQAGATQAATTTFAAAAKAIQDTGADDPGGSIGGICLALTPDVNRYWELDAYFRRIVGEPSTPEQLRSLLPRTIERLGDYLGTALDVTAETEHLMLAVTPIALEISGNLAPQEGHEKGWPLLDRFVPEMRDRIEDETGVPVPRVHIRSNASELEKDAYVIMLDEVPIVLGRVSSGAKYSPSPASALEAADVPMADLHEAPHPLSKQPGWWIPAQHWDRVQKAEDCTLWPDPMQYAVAHLEAVLRSNLAGFLGAQEAANMLDRWRRADTQRALIKHKLRDGRARDVFVRVLRELSRARVPITASESILKAVPEIGASPVEIGEVVQSVRLAIKPDLAGNRPAAKLVKVPSDTEQAILRWVASVDGRKFFAAPPEETQDLLTRLRELVPQDDPAAALTTEDAAGQDPCWRLTELEFPSVTVQSREETLPQEDRGPLAWVPLIAEWGDVRPRLAEASDGH